MTKTSTNFIVMNEAELNTIIKNNLSCNDRFFSHKLPDPQKFEIYTSNPRPFDGFAVNDDFIIYYETKLLKDFQAFNFSKIRDHQIFNLMSIKNTQVFKDFPKKLLSCIILGVYIPRKFLGLFIFDINYINNLMLNSKSILKKELLKLKEEGKYIEIKKKYFDYKMIGEKIIYE